LGWRRVKPRHGGNTFVQQPQLSPLRKFLGKISEDLGQNFTLAPLWPSDARQPDPVSGQWRRQSSLQVLILNLA